MPLANQTCWVVGGVGVVGRGITRGLLKAGATVIVNSRSEDRLERLVEDLDNPDRLVCVHGSLQPGKAEPTVADAMKQTQQQLHHVYAHGAVRWWAGTGRFENKYVYQEYHPSCDETFALNINPSQRLLDMTPTEFMSSSAQLAALHFSAAQQLIPKLLKSDGGRSQTSTYTFVTGEGGKSNERTTTIGQINSQHVWGLAAALRKEMSSSSSANETVMCREIRIGAPIQPSEERWDATRRPLSEGIGDLCAALAATASASWKREENGRLLKIDDMDQLECLLEEYAIDVDSNVGSLPQCLCDLGIFEGEVRMQEAA